MFVGRKAAASEDANRLLLRFSVSPSLFWRFQPRTGALRCKGVFTTKQRMICASKKPKWVVCRHNAFQKSNAATNRGSVMVVESAPTRDFSRAKTTLANFLLSSTAWYENEEMKLPYGILSCETTLRYRSQRQNES